MNELSIFSNELFGNLRTVLIDGKPYFVGNDVANALGYAIPHKAVQTHCKGVLKWNILSNGGEQSMLVIPEGDLYRLIMKSKLPAAEKFECWVMEEVLPSIHKHGMYAVDELLENPDTAIKAFTALKEEREKNKRLEEEKAALETETIAMSNAIEEMKPKVNYVDTILKNKSTVLVSQIANDYGMSAIAFNKLLKELHIQHKVGGQWILYAEHHRNGYVHSGTFEFKRKNGREDVTMNTEWTQKGRLFLYEELKKNGIVPDIEKENV